MLTELKCIFDKRKSFYNKALVEINGDNKKLYSYGTLVAEIQGNKFISYGKFTMTTTRHQREFAKQNGFNF